jgi:hypothetical protein
MQSFRPARLSCHVLLYHHQAHNRREPYQCVSPDCLPVSLGVIRWWARLRRWPRGCNPSAWRVFHAMCLCITTKLITAESPISVCHLTACPCHFLSSGGGPDGGGGRGDAILPPGARPGLGHGRGAQALRLQSQPGRSYGQVTIPSNDVDDCITICTNGWRARLSCPLICNWFSIGSITVCIHDLSRSVTASRVTGFGTQQALEARNGGRRRWLVEVFGSARSQACPGGGK